MVEGTGSFADGKTVKVTAADGTEQTLTADKIIIAAGSHSSLPRGIMAEHASDPACMDSTGALELTEVPKRLVVIGGGVIGVELASVYNAFGSEVTILCSPRRSHILPGLDEDLTIRLERQLKGKGVTVLPKADVTAFEHSDDGVVLSGKTGEKDFSIVCDKVLLASGRSPSIDGLGLENAGIENERGRILVNDKMETNVEGVYAIGDCLGKVMLAHTASHIKNIQFPGISVCFAYLLNDLSLPLERLIAFKLMLLLNKKTVSPLGPVLSYFRFYIFRFLFKGNVFEISHYTTAFIISIGVDAFIH